jgi:hypothetical protein
MTGELDRQRQDFVLPERCARSLLPPRTFSHCKKGPSTFSGLENHSKTRGEDNMTQQIEKEYGESIKG